MSRTFRSYPYGERGEVQTETGVFTTRSKFEQRVCEDLMDRGVEFHYEPKPALEYTLSHKYTPDLLLQGPDGKRIYIELKGYFQAVDRVKLRAVRQEHEGIDLRIIFQRGDRRLSAQSKTTYVAWAKKHGFKYAEGHRVPDAWIKEVRGKLQ